MPHGPQIPVPLPPEKLDNVYEDVESVPGISNDDHNDDNDDDVYDPSVSDEPQLFTQSELNDLVKDLDLPKDSAELLGSRLKEKNVLAPGTSFSWFRNREKISFLSFLKKVS